MHSNRSDKSEFITENSVTFSSILSQKSIDHQTATISSKNGFLIHSATIKKSLINTLANDGSPTNYQCVREFQEETQYICIKYTREALVCPPQLKQGLFTITTIDNIDHIPSSATASSLFHGTK